MKVFGVGVLLGLAMLGPGMAAPAATRGYEVQILRALASGYLAGYSPRSGSSHTQIVRFDANGPVSSGLPVYGESSNPASPYIFDQMSLFFPRPSDYIAVYRARH